MRISDWSSDVCSSDLPQIHRPLFQDGSRFHAVRQIPSDVRLHIFDTELLIRHRECRRHVLRSEPGVPSTHEGGCYCSPANAAAQWRSEEHTSELQSLMSNSYAVFCLKKKI